MRFNDDGAEQNSEQRPPLGVLELPLCPDLLALAATLPARYPALFESGEQPDFRSETGTTASPANRHTTGRQAAEHASQPSNMGWDFLAVASGERLIAHATDCQTGTRFLAQLERQTRSVFRHAPAANKALPPFRGGWVVYLGYEVAAEIEPSLRQPAPAFAFPNAFALRTPIVIARSRASGAAFLCSEPGFDALRLAVLEDMAQLARDAQPQANQQAVMPDLALAIAEDAPENFLHGVQRVKEYLAAGDVFQVNLSRAWRADLRVGTSAAAVYSRLRASNPAPFSALVQLDSAALISSSPERLIAATPASDGSICVQTRPIAGTRARAPGAAPLSQEEKQRFVHDVKEHAEHIMLIDLERNDLGRVCQAGSVQVDELLTVESYAHVHHLVSNVCGTLRAGITPVQLLAAVFPGGTITGCPKVRCMQIIAELEGTSRGPYTGALGYIGHDGQLDFNILIRTFAKVENALHFRAGAGIVMDSQPEKELAETRAKAKGLLRALG